MKLLKQLKADWKVCSVYAFIGLGVGFLVGKWIFEIIRC
jgi:hypothetical protein